jgi:hypothetical protein
VYGDTCATQVPALLEIAPFHKAACHLPADQQRAIWADLSSSSTATKTSPGPALPEGSSPSEVEA